MDNAQMTLKSEQIALKSSNYQNQSSSKLSELENLVNKANKEQK